MNITDESKTNYRGNPSINASSLGLVNQADNWAHLQSILKERDQEEPTTAMTLGTAIHAGVLEPEKKLVIKAPTVSKRSNAGKELHILHEANLKPGQVSLNESDFESYSRCVESVKTNVEAKKLLAQGNPEVEFFFNVEVDGEEIECKSKLDWVAHGYFLDLKTTKGAMSSFPWTFQNYLYHRQMAFYRLAYRSQFGRDPKCYIIAVRNEEPYSSLVFEVSESYLNLGEELVMKSLRKYKELRATRDTIFDPGIITLEPTLY